MVSFSKSCHTQKSAKSMTYCFQSQGAIHLLENVLRLLSVETNEKRGDTKEEKEQSKPQKHYIDVPYNLKSRNHVISA